MCLHTAKVEQVKFDVMELHARPELAAQQRMVDDASGDVKVRNAKMHANTKGRRTSNFTDSANVCVMRRKNAETTFLYIFMSVSDVAY